MQNYAAEILAAETYLIPLAGNCSNFLFCLNGIVLAKQTSYMLFTFFTHNNRFLLLAITNNHKTFF